MLRPKSKPGLRALVGLIRRWIMRPAYRFEYTPHPAKRQLLVDVSVIIRNDARTGIQRVVRALLGQLDSLDLEGFVLQPVFATRNHGYCKARLLSDGQVTNGTGDDRSLQPVTARQGDIFLGLDLCANLLPLLETDLRNWRKNGASIAIVVYDLLPLARQEWFPARTAKNFRRWLGVVARQADHCITISDAVASALKSALTIIGAGPLPKISSIPLGADLANSFPTKGVPGNIARLREWLKAHQVILSVGTIEPRKGHEQLLAALSPYWESKPNGQIALLLVGRRGWKTDHIVQCIQTHAEYGQRLIWLEHCSDQLLIELYKDAGGLVAMSHAEGFGLPLVEALVHGCPVLARNLPVFREIGGAEFDYFEDDSPGPLLARINAWIATTERPTAAAIAAFPRWRDSASVLANRLGIKLGLPGQVIAP